MKHETNKYLWDILDSCEAIFGFIKDKSGKEYLSDRMLRGAVERELIVIGEALAKADKANHELVNHITDMGKIIGLRNVLVHGYGEVKNELVWSIINDNLPRLRDEVKIILKR
jgi:uncharacterized protein with HEPN domain